MISSDEIISSSPKQQDQEEEEEEEESSATRGEEESFNSSLVSSKTTTTTTTTTTTENQQRLEEDGDNISGSPPVITSTSPASNLPLQEAPITKGIVFQNYENLEIQTNEAGEFFTKAYNSNKLNVQTNEADEFFSKPDNSNKLNVQTNEADEFFSKPDNSNELNVQTNISNNSDKLNAQTHEAYNINNLNVQSSKTSDFSDNTESKLLPVETPAITASGFRVLRSIKLAPPSPVPQLTRQNSIELIKKSAVPAATTTTTTTTTTGGDLKISLGLINHTSNPISTPNSSLSLDVVNRSKSETIIPMFEGLGIDIAAICSPKVSKKSVSFNDVVYEKVLNSPEDIIEFPSDLPIGIKPLTSCLSPTKVMNINIQINNYPFNNLV